MAAPSGHMAAPGATAGSIGSNTCECPDHTFTCACTGMKVPPVAPSGNVAAPVATSGHMAAPSGHMAAPAATAGSMGSNTCECSDGTFTCACTGTSIIEDVPAATAGSMAP